MTTRTCRNALFAGASSCDRASRDTDGPKTNAYRASVDPRDWKCGLISRADVADFLVKQIGDDAFLHKTSGLTSWPGRCGRRGCYLRTGSPASLNARLTP